MMHPPISNAIQGAYFVAIWITGIIFGGGSVVFADVTEGLGCLFGGFCLSMWFLVLKPGGLIPSTAGRAIFIACFTLGTFGLYVSHYTRAYGLIGSTSFAGATVIVLGIDCFSRAGLKEFWLYVWGKGSSWKNLSSPNLSTRQLTIVYRLEQRPVSVPLQRTLSYHSWDSCRGCLYCPVVFLGYHVSNKGMESHQRTARQKAIGAAGRRSASGASGRRYRQMP